MISTDKIVVLLALLGIAAGGKLSHPPNVRAGEASLMEFMIRANTLTQNSPEESMKCFAYYVPILNKISADYETAYAVCLDEEASKKGQVDQSAQAERKKITKSAKMACQRLDTCNFFNDSINYFECYVKGGSDNARIMYEISNDAADALAIIREEYQAIENQRLHCTNEADRAFIRDTDKTYDELQRCLDAKTALSESPEEEETTEDNTTMDPVS